MRWMPWKSLVLFALYCPLLVENGYQSNRPLEALHLSGCYRVGCSGGRSFTFDAS